MDGVWYALKKSMSVSDNATQAQDLADFFKNLGTSSVEVCNKLALNVLKSPWLALKIGANVGSAFANRNLEAALSSLPELINFYHTGKGVYQDKFV